VNKGHERWSRRGKRVLPGPAEKQVGSTAVKDILVAGHMLPYKDQVQSPQGHMKTNDQHDIQPPGPVFRPSVLVAKWGRGFLDTLYQKTSFLLHIIVRSLDIQNEESILKGARQKYKLTLEGKPIRDTADFSKELERQRRHGIIYF
jgi:hypothetical protein